MKTQDIVSQLRTQIPRYTDLLSDSLNIDSIVSTSNVATITTLTDHGLSDNSAVTFADVGFNNNISSITAYTLTDYDIETSVPHDLTEGFYDTVKLDGFTDSNWNDEFQLIRVHDRNSFRVRKQGISVPASIDGYLEEVRIDGVIGTYPITVVDTTTLTVEATGSKIFLDGNYSGGRVVNNIRVAGTVSLERAIELYTKQGLTGYWAFVMMVDIDVSKDRMTENDSVKISSSGTDIRMRVLDGFFIFLFKNVNNEHAAVDAYDTMRHDLMSPIMKSVFGAKFDTGLSTEPDFRAVFNGAGIQGYDRATLIYAYEFQTPYDLTEGDTVDEFNTRAFRDLDFTNIVNGDDTTDATVIPIKLDQ